MRGYSEADILDELFEDDPQKGAPQERVTYLTGFTTLVNGDNARR